MQKNEEIEDVARAVDTLRRGGIIIYPTETVWGIGCDATNTEAVSRIYAMKRRDDHKALITLVDDIPMLERTVDGIPEVAYDLIEFSEKPLTLVYDKAIGVSDRLIGKDGTLAVRVTRHDFCRRLVRGLCRPLVSTSANISGNPAPPMFSDIDPELLAAADYVCTSRRNVRANGVPSTVMRITESGEFTVIRP